MLRLFLRPTTLRFQTLRLYPKPVLHSTLLNPLSNEAKGTKKALQVGVWSCVALALVSAFYAGRKLESSASVLSKLLRAEPSSDAWTFDSRYASPEELQLAIGELRKAFPSPRQVDTDPNNLKLYGSSENSYHPTSPHAVVVHANSTEDVVKVVNISRNFRVPITVYSGSTSLEGHFAGVGVYMKLLYSGLSGHHQPVPFRQYLLGHVGDGQNSRNKW
jgi:hypothetical protein